MAIFNLYKATTGKFMRTITGDSFSRAVEAEVTAGRSLDGADLSLLGRYGDPTQLKLAGGSFKNCKLAGANMTGADLRNANMTGANMRACILNYAAMHGMTLTGADVTNWLAMAAEGYHTS